MTLSETRTEYDHRVTERLGHLCEERPPTEEQTRLAQAEAYAVIIELGRLDRLAKELNYGTSKTQRNIRGAQGDGTVKAG